MIIVNVIINIFDPAGTQGELNAKVHLFSVLQQRAWHSSHFAGRCECSDGS
uniref:Uncharacterized protein n=1 Tax=Anguilla anguilla TaxID=7936 RepID=A0A0E9SRF4_ANGAN